MAWIRVRDSREMLTPEKYWTAGYLAALEDAARACEKLEIGPDSTGERTTQARYFDAACGSCAAAVRALGGDE